MICLSAVIGRIPQNPFLLLCLTSWRAFHNCGRDAVLAGNYKWPSRLPVTLGGGAPFRARSIRGAYSQLRPLSHGSAGYSTSGSKKQTFLCKQALFALIKGYFSLFYCKRHIHGQAFWSQVYFLFLPLSRIQTKKLCITCSKTKCAFSLFCSNQVHKRCKPHHFAHVYYTVAHSSCCAHLEFTSILSHPDNPGQLKKYSSYVMHIG